MSIYQVLQDITKWLGWLGIVLSFLTVIAFIIRWGVKFRLVGATIFTFLLAASCWAFGESYSPPFQVEGAKYVPIVYDNGYDLVVAQVPREFESEDIEPTLQQIAGNLKGGGRNGASVHIRLREIQDEGYGISRPVIVGEIVKNLSRKET